MAQDTDTYYLKTQVRAKFFDGTPESAAELFNWLCTIDSYLSIDILGETAMSNCVVVKVHKDGTEMFSTIGNVFITDSLQVYTEEEFNTLSIGEGLSELQSELIRALNLRDTYEATIDTIMERVADENTGEQISLSEFAHILQDAGLTEKVRELRERNLKSRQG